MFTKYIKKYPNYKFVRVLVYPYLKRLTLFLKELSVIHRNASFGSSEQSFAEAFTKPYV